MIVGYTPTVGMRGEGKQNHGENAVSIRAKKKKVARDDKTNRRRIVAPNFCCSNYI